MHDLFDLASPIELATYAGTRHAFVCRVCCAVVLSGESQYDTSALEHHAEWHSRRDDI